MYGTLEQNKFRDVLQLMLQNFVTELQNAFQQRYKAHWGVIPLLQNICRKLSIFAGSAVECPVQAIHIQNVRRPQVGSIYIITPSTYRYSQIHLCNKNGTRKAFYQLAPSWDSAAFRVFIYRRIHDQFQLQMWASVLRNDHCHAHQDAVLAR